MQERKTEEVTEDNFDYGEALIRVRQYIEVFKAEHSQEPATEKEWINGMLYFYGLRKLEQSLEQAQRDAEKARGGKHDGAEKTEPAAYTTTNTCRGVKK
jgi:hypothetical protein